MKNRLNEFLISLSLDPQKREEFYQDPDGVLDDTSLSEDEKDLIKSGNASQIRLAIFQKPAGSLIIVGTGIRLVTQITLEAEKCITVPENGLTATRT